MTAVVVCFEAQHRNPIADRQLGDTIQRGDRVRVREQRGVSVQSGPPLVVFTREPGAIVLRIAQGSQVLVSDSCRLKVLGQCSLAEPALA